MRRIAPCDTLGALFLFQIASLEEKGSHLELELEKYLEKMYLKKVSLDVRKYLAGKYKEYEQAALREAESCEPTSDLDSSVGGPF